MRRVIKRSENVIPAKAGIHGPQLALGLRLFFCLLFFTQPALAAGACYTTSEAEAEQALRIHSELMVIGLNCQHKTPKGQKSYYYQYKDFTAKHARLFAGYEQILMNYFARTGSKAPEAMLNQLRTQMANKISGDSARMRPDAFCYYYTPRIGKAALMSEAQFRAWAGTFYAAHPLSRPFCNDVVRR